MAEHTLLKGTWVDRVVFHVGYRVNRFQERFRQGELHDRLFSGKRYCRDKIKFLKYIHKKINSRVCALGKGWLLLGFVLVWGFFLERVYRRHYFK